MECGNRKDHLSRLPIELLTDIVSYLPCKDVYSFRHTCQQLSNATCKRVKELHRRLHVSLTKPSIERLVGISEDQSLNSWVEEIGFVQAKFPTTVKEDLLFRNELVAVLSRFPNCKKIVVIDSKTYTPHDLDTPMVLARRCSVVTDRFGAYLNMFRTATSMISTTVDSLACTLREHQPAWCQMWLKAIWQARPVLACLNELDITVVMGHQALMIMPFILSKSPHLRHLRINLAGPPKSNGLGDMFVAEPDAPLPTTLVSLSICGGNEQGSLHVRAERVIGFLRMHASTLRTLHISHLAFDNPVDFPHVLDYVRVNLNLTDLQLSHISDLELQNNTHRFWFFPRHAKSRFYDANWKYLDEAERLQEIYSLCLHGEQCQNSLPWITECRRVAQMAFNSGQGWTDAYREMMTKSLDYPPEMMAENRRPFFSESYLRKKKEGFEKTILLTSDGPRKAEKEAEVEKSLLLRTDETRKAEKEAEVEKSILSKLGDPEKATKRVTRSSSKKTMEEDRN